MLWEKHVGWFLALREPRAPGLCLPQCVTSVSPLGGRSHLLRVPSSVPRENEVGRGWPLCPRDEWGLRFTAAGKARNLRTSGQNGMSASLAAPAQNGRVCHAQDTGALLIQGLTSSYGISLEQFVLYSSKSNIQTHHGNITQFE